MSNKIMVSVIIGLVLMTSVWAQQPPSWLNLGDLPNTDRIRDILEIPIYNTILACGHGTQYAGSGIYYNTSVIWKSTNGGQNWSEVKHLLSYTMVTEYMQLRRDSIYGRIWAVCSYNDNPLVYSDDVGSNWIQVSAAPSNPTIAGQTIELVGNYLYFGGTVSSPYSIALYRLHKLTLQWELVTQYPQCSGITKLKYNNGSLLVFAKDKTQNIIRVFPYTPTELDAKAIPVGKAQTSKVSSEEPKK